MLSSFQKQSSEIELNNPLAVESPPVSRAEVVRGMRLWMVEGIVATVFSNLTTGNIVTAYSLFLGCTNITQGVLGAVPSLSGLFQLLTSYLSQVVSSRRKVVNVAAILGRILWIPMAAIPFVLPKPMWVPTFITLISICYALYATSGSLWMAWLGDIVPADQRGRYFGRRNLHLGIVGVLVASFSGFFLDWAIKTEHWPDRVAFGTLFASSEIFAFLSFTLASFVPERKVIPKRLNELSTGDAIASYLRPFSDPKYSRVILFSLAVYASQGIAGNFFSVYQLKYLHQSYTVLQNLGNISTVASLCSMPLWGYISDKYGNKPVLVLSTLLVLPAPFLWCLTGPGIGFGQGALIANLSWLNSTNLVICVINLLSGVGWAGISLSQFNLAIAAAPVESRTTYLATSLAVNAIAGGIPPMIGGLILDSLKHGVFPITGIVRCNYHVLFLIAGVLRFSVLAVAIRIKEDNSRSTRYVLNQLRVVNPLSTATALNTLSRSTNSESRARAVSQLGKLRVPIAVEELVKALDDTSLPVRGTAAEALGEIGDIRAVDALVSKMEDPTSGITTEAAAALGKIGDSAALPALIDAARDTQGQPLRRIAAFEALGRLPDSAVLPILIEHLADSEHGIRMIAARALTQRSDLGDNPDLVEILLKQWDSEADPSIMPLLADALALTERPSVAMHLALGLDRAASPLSQREILSSIGSLLVGRDSFYAYLVLDRFGADETFTKIAINLQRQFKPHRGDDQSGRRSRIVARLRHALDSYTDSDYAECVESLNKAIQLMIKPPAMMATSAEKNNAFAAVFSTIASRASSGATISAEECLLLVFLLRQIVSQ